MPDCLRLFCFGIVCGVLGLLAGCRHMPVTSMVKLARVDFAATDPANGERGGALTISVAPEGRRSGELPPGPVLFTTYLRVAETGDYVPLARDVDMRGIACGRDLAAEMPVCG